MSFLIFHTIFFSLRNLVCLYYVVKEWELNGSRSFIFSAHVYLPARLISVLVYVAVVAENDGEEKIMLSGTLAGNRLKVK